MNLIHRPDGSTHDQWWSAMSMAGLLNVLEQFYQSGSATSPVLASATKHWDSIYVSRYYNWHSGTWKDVYTHGASYKLKADAPEDAVETLSKNLIVPLLEKMLADGVIHEYEVDTEAIHTEAPGRPG
jgi:basic membrane lipoprotein Med (substrate-binding protein (PBP1-ABC) superfamily)